MKAVEILNELNSSYNTMVKITQSEEWQELINCEDADPEMKTHLEDVLHYLSEAMGSVEQFLEVQSTECK